MEKKYIVIRDNKIAKITYGNEIICINDRSPVPLYAKSEASRAVKHCNRYSGWKHGYRSVKESD